jgi:predicted ABC-type ATPase
VKSYAEISDEHGVVTDPAVPNFLVHDERSYRRWQICEEVAARQTGLPKLMPETMLLATTIFKSDIPTGGDEDLVQIQEAQFGFDDILHPRNRLGRFIDTPDRPDMNPRLSRSMTPELRNPGTPIEQPFYTEAEIRAAGLDKWPEPGPKALELLGDNKTTAEMYGPEEPGDDKFPEYATDRKSGWLSLIEAELSGKTPPVDADGTPIPPHALFMAGGSASGKSTVLRENREMLAPPEQHTVHVDPDRIKEQMAAHGMTEYQEMRDAGDRYAASAVHHESGDIAALMVKMAKEAGLNVIIDGTGNSEPGLFRTQLEEMRDSNYTVDVLYVNRPTQESVNLSIIRAEREGRFVPVEKIREIHKKVSVVFRDEISHLDWLNSLIVYDAEGPIASLTPEGKMEELEGAEQRYADFVVKADEQLDEDKIAKIEASDPLNEAAATPAVPIDEWVIERPFDSSEYLRRRGPWPTWQPQT